MMDMFHAACLNWELREKLATSIESTELRADLLAECWINIDKDWEVYIFIFE